MTENDEEGKTKLSRRQQRKLLQKNLKLKAPHCKNPSLKARSKVHLRIAGFSNSIDNDNKKKKNTKKVKKNIDPDDDVIDYLPSGRLLAGTDAGSRHKAVLHLENYLKARCAFGSKGLSELDLMMLWKGLWYTLYLADHVVVQDELSKRLAKLLWCVAGTQEQDECVGQAYLDMLLQDQDEEISEENSEEDSEEGNSDISMEQSKPEEQDDCSSTHVESDEDSDDDSDDDEKHEQYSESKKRDSEEEEEEDDTKVCHCRGAHLACLLVQTSFRTMRREWGNMDKYRVDKFYMFIRYVIHEVYVYMARTNWNYGIVQLFNDAIMEEVLCCVPNGIRFHIIDISLEELAKVSCSKNQTTPLTEATFLDVIEPFLFLAQTGAGEKLVQERVLEKILQLFLCKYSVVGDHVLQQEKNEQEQEEKKPLVLNQVHVGTVAKFLFNIASDEQTTDLYRKSLYDMHKMYMKRLKLVGKDVELVQENTCVDENRNDSRNRRNKAYNEEDGSGDSVDDAKPKIENDETDKKQEQNSNNDNEDGWNMVKTKAKKGKKKERKEKKRSNQQKEKQEQNETKDDDCATDKNNNKDKDEDDSLPESKRWEECDNKDPKTELTGWEVENENTTGDTQILDMIDSNRDKTKGETNTNKERKKKSKKKEESITHSDDINITLNNERNEGDEDITISIVEQKKAKKKLKNELKKKRKAEAASKREDSGDSADTSHENEKKRKRKKENNDDNENHCEGNRRVIFESKKKFRYKSYKASMKSLNNMENPSPILRIKSPEKGILRKDTPIALKTSATVQKYNKHRQKRQQNRKRAVNYF